MENPEEVLQLLERFTKLKQKEIPRELDDYLGFVARTGDTVYRWAVVKQLIRTKLMHVITDFYDNTPSIADLPQCPNVDPFNYEQMRRMLIDRLDSFNSAPFTVQRICELITEPRKQYTRIDKFMRAVEKNILVVSTQEPGRRRYDSENGDSLDSIVNGDLEVNVDIEMDNEAFGIDSSEMGSNSTTSSSSSLSSAAASSSSTSSSSTTTTSKTSEAEIPPEESMVVSTAPSDVQETEKSPDESVEIAAIGSSTNGESIVDSDPKIAEPTLVSTTDENDVSNDKATPNLEEAAPLKDDTEEKEENVSQSDDKIEPVIPEIVAEPDTVNSAALIENQETDLSESTENGSANDLQPALESSVTNDVQKEESTDVRTSVTAAAIIRNNSVEESVDDGQPQAKMAKLSNEKLEDKTVELAEISSSVTSEVMVEQAKYKVSESTTNPEESSTSVDSESSSTISNSSNQHLTVTAECSPVAAAAEEPQSAKDEVGPTVSEITSVVEPQTELISEIRAHEELPTESCVLSSDTVTLKPLTVELEPAVTVAADEMETVSSTVVPENEMATDEEEATSKPVDAVVPMAADILETAKPDDNAMDVDESSVEPMDQ
ncbi:serine/threonine-protein phosphatase 4 regulatory subunit 2 [Topomyia yanbarensis]|uniref:serine/threonine-protein phosphatase 4 regulatory subunit 2 n=1 Tax=Topomyia yanbarensis TaxID=2498891 RepID=UPI00273BDA86|nr:serine/threonine-protein phosphatase 4 regulatory subunit 2 [Topomyia yanbarensis]